MIGPTYVNQSLLRNLLNHENPYVIMTSSINNVKDDEAISPTSQRRRHTHDSVFRSKKIESLDDPLYETMSSYVRNNNNALEEKRYVSINELSQQFNKKLTKVHERRPTRMKIQRPVSITLPASSYDQQKQHQQEHNNTICDQWLQVFQQQTHDENERCLQHIHRTSRRRSANILRETRSNELNQPLKIYDEDVVLENNNKNDLKDDNKIIAYTTLQKQKLFTKERKKSCDELHDVCFGPLLL